MTPDYSDQNLALTQAWERRMRAEEAAEQAAEDRMIRMRSTPHGYRKGGGIVGFCAVCGVNYEFHGKDWS